MLFIDEESGNRRLSYRLCQVMRGHDADENLPLAYMSLAQFNFLKPAHTEELTNLIRNNKASFVVIDALADVMPGGDENLVKDVLPMFRSLRSVAEDTESAIVLIHHSNRAGEFRGSSAIQGAVDLMLEVNTEPGKSSVKFKSVKTRDIDHIVFSANAVLQDDCFWLESTAAGVKIKKPNPTEDLVVKYLAQKSTGSTDDIVAGVISMKKDTVAKATVRKAINTLETNWGYVLREDDGGQGEGATYGLTYEGSKYAFQRGYLKEPYPW